MIVAVPLPFGMRMHALCGHKGPRAVNGAPSAALHIRQADFTPELREVFALTAAAFFHQPKALCGRA